MRLNFIYQCRDRLAEVIDIKVKTELSKEIILTESDTRPLRFQVEPQNNQWNFGFSDSVFKGYPQFEYAANLYSFTVEDIGYQVPWKACETPGCGWNVRRLMAVTDIPPGRCIRIDIRKWGSGVYFVISQDQLRSKRIVIRR